MGENDYMVTLYKTDPTLKTYLILLACIYEHPYFLYCLMAMCLVDTIHL